MSGPEKISKVERLRARDGDNCWLCNKPMKFDAKPNAAQAWSIEHLIPDCRGGPSTLENLVLCHVVCNRRLAALSVKEKVDRRERRLRKQWVAAAKAKLQKVTF